MLYGEMPEMVIDGQAVQGFRVRIPNPPKTAVVRLPTAKEILERLDQGRSRARTSRRRGATNQDLKPDMDLFKKVRLDQGEEFDEYEAASIIGRLTSCEATSCERDGDYFLITLKTPFGETVHTISAPTQKAIVEFRRNLAGADQIGPVTTLFDSVSKTFTGYAAGFTLADIPINHKSAVVMDLLNELDGIDPIIDPNS